MAEPPSIEKELERHGGRNRLVVAGAQFDLPLPSVGMVGGSPQREHPQRVAWRTSLQVPQAWHESRTGRLPGEAARTDVNGLPEFGSFRKRLSASIQRQSQRADSQIEGSPQVQGGAARICRQKCFPQECAVCSERYADAGCAICFDQKDSIAGGNPLEVSQGQRLRLRHDRFSTAVGQSHRGGGVKDDNDVLRRRAEGFRPWIRDRQQQ